MVGGNVISNLKRNGNVKLILKRSSFGVGLDIGTLGNFSVLRIICRKSADILGYLGSTV